MSSPYWPSPYRRLQLRRKKARLRALLLRALVLILVGGVAFLGATYLARLLSRTGLTWTPAQALQPEIVVQSQSEDEPEAREITKTGLAKLIGPHAFTPDELHAFSIEDEAGMSLFVRTTLEPELQAWALRFLGQTRARSAALVGLDPAQGHVLVMASFRADGRPVNLALESSFPAASLFKIVTAAAAVEKKKLSSASRVSYDGRKHTLYRKHVQADVTQGRHRATLKEGFADSINTVFGKVGAFTLGPKALAAFAQRFYFNRSIRFEMPVQESQFALADEDPYHLAELASGFNRTTKVSPLHGAMLAAAVVNNGRLMEPTVVREVFDQDNNIYYRQQPASLGQVVSPRTAAELKRMMQATVTEGTGRRVFRDADRHRVLSQLTIGGKSGTINDEQGQKVDWFVSYATDPRDKHSLALAAVVVHDREKLGVRAQAVVREAIIRHFAPQVKDTQG